MSEFQQSNDAEHERPCIVYDQKYVAVIEPDLSVLLRAGAPRPEHG